MPSFTRRTPTQTARPPAGTIPSLSATTPPHHLLPTGIPSIDDLLGGGLPLGNIFLLFTPDSQTSWSRLVSRYWIAQGLVTGQKSVVVGDDSEASELVGGCMWVDERGVEGSESEGEGIEEGAEGKTKIAWRYERMKKFQTTVSQGGSKELNLMSTIPRDFLDHLHRAGIQEYIPLDSTEGASTSSKSWRILSSALRRIHTLLAQHHDKSALRITIHELGSIDWEEASSAEVHRFLHALKYMVRSKSAGVLVTLPAELARRSPRGEDVEEWMNTLSWVVDAAVELRGFGDDPTLPPLFYPLHGLLTLPTFPTTHHLLPPTLKHSSLLGLSTGSSGATGGGGGAGENNLGFRLKRKRFVVETVHLGIEGGTGERRTAPVEDVGRLIGTGGGVTTATAAAPAASEGVDTPEVSAPSVDAGVDKPRGAVEEKKKKPRARVRFGGEEELGAEQEISVQVAGEDVGHGRGHDHTHDHSHGPKNPRPAVRHDRPDLYEF